ncbi:MAG: c-type cytochrome [Halioglobus sp.]
MRFFCATIIGLFSVFANPVFSAGTLEVGKTTYATCAACHGVNAEGNQALNAPRLTHLSTVYIVAQLQKFKAGTRGGPESSASARQMAPMAATLADDQAVIDVATYIASMEAPAAVHTLEGGDPAVGADYYNQFCGACHGATAQGNNALNSPRLRGADDWYLLSQLQAFRAGSRGTHPDDRTGKQMRAMAGLLPDDTIVKDVVFFISRTAAP